MIYYYGIFPDGNTISKYSLEEVAVVPGIEYFLKQERKDVGNNNWVKTQTLINADGSVNFLRIGDFDLRDIGAEFYDKNKKEHFTRFTFYEHRADRSVQIDIGRCYDEKFIKRELIPLMNKLNELGSYEMYLKSLEFDELKADNDRYRQEIQSLKEQINDLKKLKVD